MKRSMKWLIGIASTLVVIWLVVTISMMSRMPQDSVEADRGASEQAKPAQVSTPPPAQPPTKPVNEPPTESILAMAEQNGLKTFCEAVKIAGIPELFEGAGKMTVFAPSDEAFNALGEERRTALFADPEALKQVLLKHVIADRGLLIQEMPRSTPLTTVAGTDLSVSTQAAKNDKGDPVTLVFIEGARIKRDNRFFAKNGLLFKVEEVFGEDPAAGQGK